MKDDRVLLDHGSGGLATKRLIEEFFLSRLANDYLSRLEDSAVVPVQEGRLAFTTDSYVVDPIFFPGGDIGSLAVYGTINDLAMQGAAPMALSMGLILEEGLMFSELERVAESISQACIEAGVAIAAADTKVVPLGKGDKIFINTSGIGRVPKGLYLGAHRARPGDVVIVSGFVGDHGAAILTARSNLSFGTEIKSDSAPLHALVSAVLEKCPSDKIRLFRDPTRGGLATVLNEIAMSSNVCIEIDQDAVPIRQEVSGVCELLGLDPLYLANEGKCVVVVEEDHSQLVMDALSGLALGRHAAVIGCVKELGGVGRPVVTMNTSIGGRRIISMLSGEPLPRIC